MLLNQFDLHTSRLDHRGADIETGLHSAVVYVTKRDVTADEKWAYARCGAPAPDRIVEIDDMISILNEMLAIRLTETKNHSCSSYIEIDTSQRK